MDRIVLIQFHFTSRHFTSLTGFVCVVPCVRVCVCACVRAYVRTCVLARSVARSFARSHVNAVCGSLMEKMPAFIFYRYIYIYLFTIYSIFNLLAPPAPRPPFYLSFLPLL